MKIYIYLLFLIVSCVGQKLSNVDSSYITSGAGKNDVRGIKNNNFEDYVTNKDIGDKLNDIVGGGISKNSDDRDNPSTKNGDIPPNYNGNGYYNTFTDKNRNLDSTLFGNFDIFGYYNRILNKTDYEKNSQEKIDGRVFSFDGKEFRFEFDAGNPDIYAKIERPCEVYDSFCVRRFFAEHSQCRISGGPVPDPLYRAQLTVNYPRVNMSATLNNIEYKGLNNVRVEEFYINKATDNLIITLDFESISISSKNTFLKYYLRGKEPVVTRDFGGLVYGKLSVTVIIPYLKDLRLDKAEIYTFANSPVFPFVTGPGLAESTDPAIPIMFAEFFANVPFDEQEAVLTEGNFYAATYIQYNICDFGLKVL